MTALTFIVPVADEDVYRNNFLLSQVLANEHPHQVIAQRGFCCAGEAYNDALDRAVYDRIVCAHQDVILPANWDRQFCAQIEELDHSHWAPIGIVGCIGITPQGDAAGHIYRYDREFFPNLLLPAKVASLDELLISFRKSSGLRFDNKLPSFHFYAVDMCLQAQSRGLSNMAVNAPCYHQGKNRDGKPAEFFLSRNYMVRKWKHVLPVPTLSGALDQRSESFWWQEAKKAIRRFMGQKTRYWWEDLPTIDPERVRLSTGTAAAFGPVEVRSCSSDQP